jgi:ABC-2 type transport system permease protein
VSGFGVFLGKELQEIRRTWRIWVIPGLTIFFAITGPVIALLTPVLMESLAGSQPGVVVKLPTPTAREAFGQFLKSMSQIVMIALVITGAGAVSGERSSGTAILVLTKPLSRRSFVLAKLVSQQVLLIASTVVGMAVTIGVTAALFDNLPVRAFVTATGIWLASAMMFLGVMVLCSVAFRARGAAAGAGLAVLFGTLILSIWPPLNRWTFVGLTGASGSALMGREVSVLWPLVTAGIVLVLVTVVAVRVFDGKEL